jgi:cysteine sulfinate desulfinase/cysteine desulfurase-like protein
MGVKFSTIEACFSEWKPKQQKKMQQMNKSKSKKLKSVRNSASERRVAYEIEIEFSEISETNWGISKV